MNECNCGGREREREKEKEKEKERERGGEKERNWGKIEGVRDEIVECRMKHMR